MYVPKLVFFGVLSCHYNNLLANDFEIEKTSELIAEKYFWPKLHWDFKVYIKDYKVCLAFKAV